MFTRFTLLLAAFAAVPTLVPTALAVRVHVRVEGKTRTIFGASSPLLEGGANALTALDAAGAAGEFYYDVKQFSFGPFVDQIGRYPSAGNSGWVYKVNGSSPPVAADQYQLKEGDTVLWYWADFGPTGSSPTLALSRSGRCYSVVAQDDTGKSTPAAGAVLRIGSKRTVATRAGRACVGRHPGSLVRATMEGAVRSNALP